MNEPSADENVIIEDCYGWRWHRYGHPGNHVWAGVNHDADMGQRRSWPQVDGNGPYKVYRLDDQLNVRYSYRVETMHGVNVWERWEDLPDEATDEDMANALTYWREAKRRKAASTRPTQLFRVTRCRKTHTEWEPVYPNFDGRAEG